MKSGRIHRTLSDLEYNYFLLLEFSDEMIDIREQYPLLASTRARDIAAEMGIRYPMYVGTQLPGWVCKGQHCSRPSAQVGPIVSDPHWVRSGLSSLLLYIYLVLRLLIMDDVNGTPA